MDSNRSNLILVGMSGTGKSTIGRIVANKLEYAFFDTDAEIEKRTGVQISWIFELEGECKFRERESEVLRDLTRRNRIVLATGGGIVLRESNRDLLNKRGQVVCLTAPIADLVERIGSARTRPVLQHEESIESALVRMQSERNPLYDSVTDVSFDTYGHSKLAVALDIVAWYSKRSI
ncbi:MAG: shikimate kinase [Gammaproteobacteria bacterium]|nr:shikimate kinase [Gammaproteobacteria bacterium]